MTKKEITKIIDQAADRAAIAAEKRVRKFASAAIKASEKRFQQYVGTQKEHFDEKVEVIGEQYLSIKATQDEHTQILVANQETLLEHDAKLSEMSSTLKRIESKLDTKADQSTVDQIERRVTALETNR